MKILVPVGSRSGWTAQIGEWVADELTTLGHDVTLAKAVTAPAPDGFDAVVIGSGIRASNWNGEALAWVKENAQALATIPFATFTSSLVPTKPDGGGQEEADGYTAKVMKSVGLTNRAHRSFAGGYDPKRVTLPERLIMRALGQSHVVDALDEDAAREWTREMVREIGAE